MMMRGMKWIALAVLLSVNSTGRAATAEQCLALTQLKIPGVALIIDNAEVVPAGKVPALPFKPAFDATVPEYCRLDGTIDRRVGRHSKPYAIGFSIALPVQWNGRFLFQGGGGLNGSVSPPLGLDAIVGEPALARGFAVVSTDSGHQGAVFDASFFEDQQATLDFLYQAIGKVTLAAKQIIEQHYGRQPEHSYYVGCSTGGREAMLMSQRYPTYFDGIVAGAPAMRTSYSNLADRYVATQLNAIAPKDASGASVGSQALSDSDRKLVVDGLLKACDAHDGAVDGMVFNTQACRFDPAALVCNGEKTAACLRADQAEAIKAGFAGPRNSAGRAVYPGFPYDTGIAASASTSGIPGLLLAAAGPVGPPSASTTMNIDQEALMADTAVSRLGDSDMWTDLNTFSDRGGKLIFYHGASDPWFSALDTVQYYERLADTNGGAEKVRSWSRLFLVPGMGHCAGGAATLDRFDMVDAVVNWVEKDVAPASIIATGKAFPQRSRPLCPYPQYPHYKGKGSGERAENFECRS